MSKKVAEILGDFFKNSALSGSSRLVFAWAWQ
jgi:hypothetical protein